MTFAQSRKDWEFSYWSALLVKNRWNVANVAKEADVARTSLYRRFEELGIELPKGAFRYRRNSLPLLPVDCNISAG